MEYRDLELLVDDRDGAYRVVVVRSPAGEAREQTTLSLEAGAFERRLAQVARGIGQRPTRGAEFSQESEETTARAEELGAELFETLFTGEVRGCLDDSLQLLDPSTEGLRLKLRLEAPELAALPWELMRDPRPSAGGHFALSRSTPLVRYLAVRGALEPLKVDGPLHLLAMAAQPADLEHLGIERERRWMGEAVAALQARGDVTLDWVEGETWSDLQRAMRKGPWHVFHFIGHGGFDREKGEGYIALAGSETHHRLGASELGLLLANHPQLRLAVLNSCEGARGGEEDLFSSTAAVLVRGGIPAVVAMQFPITDEAATEFSRVFYESLADGLPVDASVAEARVALRVKVPERMEWATPVLQMRSSDGALFQLKRLWDRNGALWMGLVAAAYLMFLFLAPTAFFDPSTIWTNVVVAGLVALLMVGVCVTGTPRDRLKRFSASVSHSHVLQGTATALVFTVGLFTWRSGLPAFANALTSCSFAHVECLDVGEFEGASELSSLNFVWTGETREALYQKLSRIPDLQVHRSVGGSDSCTDRCVDGRFGYDEGAFKLIATPVDGDRSLGDIVLRRETESYGIILQAWHELADSLLVRFGIEISRTLRDSLREIPTADTLALRLNNEATALALAARDSTAGARDRLFEAALTMFDGAIGIDPRYASPHANKGNLYMSYRGRYDLAVDAFQAAIERLVDFAPYQYGLGRAYSGLGEAYRDDAIRELERAIEIDPRFLPARHDLGVIHLLDGRLERARAELDAALEVDSTYVPARFNRGRVALRSGEYESALRELGAAEEAWREDVSVRIQRYVHVAFLLARAESALGNVARGCEWIDVARRRDPIGFGPWADSVTTVAWELDCP